MFLLHTVCLVLHFKESAFKPGKFKFWTLIRSIIAFYEEGNKLMKTTSTSQNSKACLFKTWPPTCQTGATQGGLLPPNSTNTAASDRCSSDFRLQNEIAETSLTTGEGRLSWLHRPTRWRTHRVRDEAPALVLQAREDDARHQARRGAAQNHVGPRQLLDFLEDALLDFQVLKDTFLKKREKNNKKLAQRCKISELSTSIAAIWILKKKRFLCWMLQLQSSE